MCICVDCAWVDSCKTYYTVEENHGVRHLSENPDFQGNNPKIHINILILMCRNFAIYLL